jgi:hypothetical protein
MSMDNHGGIMPTGETPNSSTRALWKSCQQSYLVAKQEELAKKIMNLALQSISIYTFKGSLTNRNILLHGADGFTSPPKEGVLQIFITHKNPSLSAGFEPVNLGSNGKNDNHYTTEDDRKDFMKLYDF